MAAPLPVPLGVECKLLFTLNGQPHALNILHFKNASGGAITQGNADTIDTAIKGAFATSGLAAQFVTTVALASVSTRSMVANTDPWFVGAGAPAPGTAIGKPLPAATSFVVTLRTGQRGRSFNGRTYLAGWGELANDALGGATTAARSAALAFLDGIRVALVTGTPPLTLAILSRVTTPAGTDTAVVRPTPLLTDVTAIVAADLRWDTQRRRAIPGV